MLVADLVTDQTQKSRGLLVTDQLRTRRFYSPLFYPARRPGL